jgi:predicted nuclease of predicted toxin-antitoxin system
MKILIDMNLSPRWVPVLENAGFEAVHWSTIGDHRASDRVIMDYAGANGYVVFTHDLDFGAILAATEAQSPSVIQVRIQNVDADYLGPTVVALLRQCRRHLEAGALVSLDETSRRVRILPIRR